ncbi:MAG: ABC transporter permease [Sphaerochaetaceae bacterium]|jgi:ribose/xylose/arabinose/galactoside ABC-type transport system permease subunit|nr:ABC transporter permease [Sphaerochaetaceae bacterium]MDD3365925.1 ABC transporter permease [Sphaerochaetaceae bacterium]MDD4219841.1 ABC transporter permease [Sphaerochaetaceae bacterium]MDY0371732.1 ABC transporter permease [Sphaerochaetaceae bacterium]
MEQVKRKNFFGKISFKDQRVLMIAVILLITVVVTIISPKFVDIRNIVAIFQQISVLGILTMAMALLLISGGIDLSIGNIMILSGVVTSKVIMGEGSVTLAITLGLLTGLVCGFLNGVIIAKSRCLPLIITLGTSQIFFGTSLMITGGQFMNFSRKFDFIGRTRIFGVFPVMLIFLIVMVAVAFILLNYTRFGRRIVAIGGNERNAYLSGINIDRYKIILYSISGVICAIASIVFVSRLDSITATAGSGYELRALTAAIIGGITFDGGRGTIGGAFIGVLLLGIINNAMNILSVWPYAQTAISGAIIVIAVILSNLDNIRKDRR